MSHASTHTHAYTSQPQVFAFVKEDNKRLWDNERRRWPPLREAMNERSRGGGRRGNRAGGVVVMER